MKEITDLVQGARSNFRRACISETRPQQMQDPAISTCTFIQVSPSPHTPSESGFPAPSPLWWPLSLVRMGLGR